MKKYLLLLSVISFFAACKNSADEPIVEDDSLSAPAGYLWQSTLNDSSGRLEMKKVPVNDSLTTGRVIDSLNKDNPNIKLALIKTSHDTIYLKIDDAHYLTQQMGSTGSTLYLAEVIYNLTEIPGIKQVNLDFEEGDHASPGTFNRESFKDE